jgi:hypothetical protein
MRPITSTTAASPGSNPSRTDDTRNCDDLADYLKGTYPDLKDGVLVIHTKDNGEISESVTGKNKEELEQHFQRLSGFHRLTG